MPETSNPRATLPVGRFRNTHANPKWDISADSNSTIRSPPPRSPGVSAMASALAVELPARAADPEAGWVIGTVRNAGFVFDLIDSINIFF